MKALVKAGPEPGLQMEDVPEPKRAPQEVLIKVRKSSICGTDLHIWHWDEWAQKTIPIPLTIGHEFMGEIVEVGSAVRKRKVRERVVVCSFVACGRCWYCTHELYSLCDNGNPNPALTETL